MIPCSMTSKLFYSLLGAAVNSLLDILPAVLVLMLAFRENPLTAVGWLFVNLSITLYASAVGAFMDQSIPIAAGNTIKQTMQIMFVYFGLLPDAAVLLVATVLDLMPFGWAVVCVVALNMVLTVLFTIFAAKLLSPKVGSLNRLSGYIWDKDRIRGQFSRIGWALFALFAGGSLAQLVAMALAGMVEDISPNMAFLVSFLPLYLIGYPLGIWIMKKAPTDELIMGKAAFAFDQLKKKRVPGLVSMIRYFFVAIFLAYTGVLVGNIINNLLAMLFGSGSANVVAEMVDGDTLLMQLIFMVIAAPIMEEYVFRKLIVDRMAVFGEKRAILYSAVIFGLFHGNLQQTIYAFSLGLLLGYVYIRTRKLRYSIGLHMAFNFLGSIVAGSVERGMLNDLQNLGFTSEEMASVSVTKVFDTVVSSLQAGQPGAVTGLASYLLYLGFLVMAYCAGLMITILGRKKVAIYKAPQEITDKKCLRYTWGNGGMLVFTILMIFMILLVLASSILQQMLL